MLLSILLYLGSFYVNNRDLEDAQLLDPMLPSTCTLLIHGSASNRTHGMVSLPIEQADTLLYVQAVTPTHSRERAMRNEHLTSARSTRTKRNDARKSIAPSITTTWKSMRKKKRDY